MSVLETVLVFVVVPLGAYLLMAIPLMARKLRRRPRYRPGEPWPYSPIWWTANPEGADLPEHPDRDSVPAQAGRGGAHGGW